MKKKEKLLEKDLKDHELQNIEFLENKEAEENRRDEKRGLYPQHEDISN